MIVCADIPELNMCKFLSVDFIGYKFVVKLFLFFTMRKLLQLQRLKLPISCLIELMFGVWTVHP